MTTEKEPYGLIIALIPVVLRINLQLLVVKNKKYANLTFLIKHYPANSEDISDISL
jgi:hypothetical protein